MRHYIPPSPARRPPAPHTRLPQGRRESMAADRVERPELRLPVLQSPFTVIGNSTLTDIVAARDPALCLAGVEALAGLFLLVWRERRLAAEFDALRLGVGSAACCAFENASAFELRRNAKNCEDDLGRSRTLYPGTA